MEELDAEVAAVEGMLDADTSAMDPSAYLRFPAEGKRFFWRPSSSWNDGGPLIEKYGIELATDGPAPWAAYIHSHWAAGERAGYEGSGHGDTPLIAAMRALVDYKKRLHRQA